MKISQRIDTIIGFSAENTFMARYGRERIRSVRRVIFVYYLAILLPFIGIAASFPDLGPTRIVGAILMLAVVLRFRHWARPLPEGKREDVNPRAARVTAVMVILLSCAQAYFYIAMAFAIKGQDPNGYGWAAIFGVGLLAGLTQGAALTGVVFASRAIFLCFVFPLALVSTVLFPAATILAPLAMLALSVIGFYLAEISHKTQLNLFRAQVDADEALARTERTNLKLVKARRNAQYRAEYDGLTGVRNRYAFMRDIEAAIEAGQSGVLAVLDLDRFKPINDLYGHHAGDLVLRFVARRLQRSLPDDAIVGRLGGDEFGLFVCDGHGTQDVDDLVATCDRAMARLRRPIRLSNSSVSIGGSAGGRTIDGEGIGVAQALQDADSALYVAKREGLDTVRLFDNAIRDEATRVNAIEAEMLERDALDHFSLAYQPIVNLRTGELASFEALARWHHPRLGAIPPAQFIALAERNGRIREITLVLLGKALDFASDWDPACRLSFNLSAAHICGDNAANEIVRVIAGKGFPAHRLQFEITETAMLVNFDAARRNIAILRGAGCRIALDDFGAGFASLEYLREIQFDKVKIDGSLIRSAREPAGRDMLRGVIKMITAMKLESVAEFIATDADRDTALKLGAKYGQGYFLGRPLRAMEVETLLATYRRSAGSDLFSLERRSGLERRIVTMPARDGPPQLSAARNR